MSTTMKAIRFHGYGGAEVMKYEDVPRPVPKANEVLIHVHAMGVNPVDWKIREGYVKARMNIPLPATPGGDVSGVIEDTGAGVGGFGVGEPVYAMLGLLGAYAEYVVAIPAIVAPKPATIDHLQAASVPLAALTAWQALFEHGGLQRGQKVLIHAAAGGVGSFAVQFAHCAGATVLGTGSAGNAEYVRGLGADQYIDYQTDSFDEYAGSCDVVFDLIGGETSMRSLALLKKGGIHIGGVPPSAALIEKSLAAGLRTMAIQVKPSGAQLREIAAQIDAGKVKTTIAATFPLAEADRAHALSKSGHTRGKIVLQNSG